MKITADANIILRALVEDDKIQTPIAKRVLEEADLVALTLPALCEFVWVMLKGYKESHERIAAAIRTLIAAGNTEADVAAVEAGLAFLDAGGDFADGVIAHEGRWLGGETFVSFDENAVKLVQGNGEKARVPA
ncbi:type II toxin-antitoxin system VapC family toxin [Sphingobium sp. H39-3-25]|uniref:type II toxin-antitoxin system VapC family toxin n=1 Tax=Sphingomonadales TaxID=204457 RepID=UPI00082CB9A6|nr:MULTISPECIES: type II toxin-antitoxin system VapC family toxin [Sphingomonadaceae]MDF0491106.1 type II toxin-antitoxin system VapC family toxin [Sphingomonas pollutisoli]MDF0545163.1 type II toxin-antitoxin system VapC family toxin [Sphingobium arseniciresistens]